MRVIKLGLFDYDGTIATRGNIPKTVLNGLVNLHSQDILTTVTTGKTIKQLHHRLEDYWSKVVSSGVPVSTENGGRLSENDKNVKFHPIQNDEISAVMDVVDKQKRSIIAVAYQPEEINSNLIVWSPNSRNLQDINAEDDSVSVYPMLTVVEFFHKVQNDKPCMLVVASADNNVIESFPDGLNFVTNEGVININSNNVNKGTGLIELSELVGIPLPNIMVAGNDKNDISLIETHAGTKIWIGDKLPNYEIYSDVIQITSPESFGKYLSGLQTSSI